MAKITFRKEERAKTLIQELLDATFFNSEGQPTHYVEFDTDARYEILARNLHIDGIKDIDRIRNLTQAAIHSMKARDETGIDKFTSALEKLSEDYLDLPHKAFKILFVMNARNGEIGQLLPLELFNIRIELSNWTQVTQHFEYKEWAEDSSYGGITGKDEMESFAFVPLIASTYERGADESFQKANQVIHLFRALLNLVQDFGRRRFGRSPLADFLPSPSYGIFSETGSYQTLYYTTQRYKYTAKSLSEEDVSRFKTIVARLRQPSSETDTMGLVLDAIDKYGRAIDAIEWYEAFLWLWQILELVTLQTENIRMDDVVGRLKVIHKYDLLWSDIFDALKDIRNEFVHRGQFSQSGMHEVNFLKVAVENLIFWLIDATKNLPTRKHLEWFYSYAPRGDADLNKLLNESSDQEFNMLLQKLLDSRSRNQKGTPHK